MADEFKSFDKTPIINLINLNRWKFGLREIILGAIALLLLFLCVILASLVGKANNELSELAATQSQAYIDERMCVDIGCMETATRAMELRNKSVDPCENFYEYACGNYQNVAPVYLDGDSMQLLRHRRWVPFVENRIRFPYTRSVLEDLTRQNEDRMMDLLDSPISDAHDASYERKLKQYFQACNNMFDRDTKRGAPLLKIISELGGWKLLGNWKQDWNFNDALKKVQADFGIEALYSIKVRKDYFSSEKADVDIFQSGTSEIMGVDMYLDKRFQNAYKTFIKNVGTLLVNDAITLNITQDNGTTESDLDEFVNDTFTIESRLAKFAFYNTDNFLTNLTALNAESRGLIDWVQQLNYFFGTVNITGATEVKFQNKDFLSDMITSLPAQHMHRMMHNYLIWRVAESYGMGLSWDYMQSVKSFGKQLTRIFVHLDSRYFCIITAENKLEDALSALYVRHFFNEENKRTVHEITDNIKLALQSQLEKTPWMDATTKQYAKEKLDKTIFRMGYPDWIGNQTYVDVMYSDLTINASDHFDNLISINRFLVSCKRYEFNNLRFWPEDFLFSDFFKTLGPIVEENIVFASAGVLQYPIYSSKQPHFASFGSLGAILGRAIHYMIGDIGKDFDKQGHQLSVTWWSDASVTAYEKVRTCLTDFCNDATTTDVRRYGRQDIADLIAWRNGVRLALIGYKDWVKRRGIVEKVLPGIGLNNQQMIFLAHAQTFCYVKDDIPKWIRFSDIQNDDRLNKALGQLEDFSRAFHCKPEAKMNHKGNCGYY